MDHFVIFIWQGAFSESDEVLIRKYFYSLFPTDFESEHVIHTESQVAFMLKPKSKYIALLNKLKNNGAVEWKDLNDDLNIQNIISKEVIVGDSTGDFILKDFIQQVPVSLHTLADQLPAFGSYKLDVLLDPNILKTISVSEEPALASAFYRLLKWHSGNFTIPLEEPDSDKLTEWCEFMNAHTVQINNIKDLGSSLWRGSIQLPASNTPENILCPGFALNFDLLENICPVSTNCENTIQEDSEFAVVSSKLHFIDQCRFSSIPSYMISPVVFRLNLNQPKFLEGRSSFLINYLSNIKDDAMILRLNYSKIKEKPKPDKKYCFNRWTKAISSGSIKDADSSVLTFKDCITFAITKSRQSDNIIAFPFRDPNSLSPDFYYNFVNLKSSTLSSHMSVEEEINKIHKIKQELHFIEPSYFNKIITKLLSTKMDFYKNGDFNSAFNSSVSTLWEKVRPFEHSFIKVETPVMHCEGIDPSDWPERICLLSKQMQTDKEEKCFPLNAMQSRLGHKKSQQSVTFSIEDIWLFFLPSGESKNSNAESVCSLGNLSHRMKYDFDVICGLKWPEVLNYAYHDLYYNFSNQAEKREAEGNKMINCYVRLETASICDRQQNAQDFSIIIPEKSSENKSEKKFRSPSYRKAQRAKLRDVNKRNSNDCIEDLMKDLITKKILTTSRTSCSENGSNKDMQYKKDINKNSTRENLKRKNEFPIRYSPRKKKPVDYKYSSQNNRISNTNKTVSKSSKSELSDLLRRKLRYAVGIALANNGIKLSDAFFQPCGKRLFTICKAFVQDISQKEGKVSDFLQKIADAHVKQVIEFERQNLNVK